MSASVICKIPFATFRPLEHGLEMLALEALFCPHTGDGILLLLVDVHGTPTAYSHAMAMCKSEAICM